MDNRFTNLNFPDVLLNKLPRAYFHIYFLNVFHNWETHMVSFFSCLLGIETWQLWLGHFNQVSFPGSSCEKHWTAQCSLCLQYETECYTQDEVHHPLAVLHRHLFTECELLWQKTCWAPDLANRDTSFPSLIKQAVLTQVTAINIQDTNNCGWIYSAGRRQVGKVFIDVAGLSRSVL